MIEEAYFTSRKLPSALYPVTGLRRPKRRALMTDGVSLMGLAHLLCSAVRPHNFSIASGRVVDIVIRS
jgi:hypothetical protein